MASAWAGLQPASAAACLLVCDPGRSDHRPCLLPLRLGCAVVSFAPRSLAVGCRQGLPIHPGLLQSFHRDESQRNTSSARCAGSAQRTPSCCRPCSNCATRTQCSPVRYSGFRHAAVRGPLRNAPFTAAAVRQAEQCALTLTACATLADLEWIAASAVPPPAASAPGLGSPCRICAGTATGTRDGETDPVALRARWRGHAAKTGDLLWV
jgi:hypothetical protein